MDLLLIGTERKNVELRQFFSFLGSQLAYIFQFPSQYVGLMSLNANGMRAEVICAISGP